MDTFDFKRVKHYDLPGHFRELTFSCYHRLPLLDDDEFRRMLSTSISRAIDGHRYGLVCYVYMPEHVHMVVYSKAAPSGISGLLFAIKRPFSFRAKQLLQSRNDPRLPELIVRERPGRASFRFWQEGPGYDRNIHVSETLRTSIDYIHMNPVRRGLCDHPRAWKWSSYHFHQSQVVDPDLPPISTMPL